MLECLVHVRTFFCLALSGSKQRGPQTGFGVFNASDRCVNYTLLVWIKATD